MELIGAFFASIAGVVVFTGGMDAPSVGFVVSFTIRLTGHLSSLLSSYTSLEMDLNSLEWMLDYCSIETEDESPAHCVRWPKVALRLEVTGLRASYSPELPPVLECVTFQALPRQRIGITGRTGAGKSSLALALTRFIDPARDRDDERR
ncbi:hypothetical protein N7527_008656 [Penicillium freii]|nr:hypothetical protein N7527_008656 [Penicillium freii]